MSLVECIECGWIGSDNDFDGDFRLSCVNEVEAIHVECKCIICGWDCNCD